MRGRFSLTSTVYGLLMASIRERSRKDGATTWAVLWRDAGDGRRTSRTFEDQREARLLKDFLDANGNSYSLAAKAASRMRSQALTVATVVEAHIEGLTGVLPGTRSKPTEGRQAHHAHPGGLYRGHP